MDEERILWRLSNLECVLISCCAGAELQVRRVDGHETAEVVVRELYPTKSDLYERARMLEREYRAQEI